MLKIKSQIQKCDTEKIIPTIASEVKKKYKKLTEIKEKNVQMAQKTNPVAKKHSNILRGTMNVKLRSNLNIVELE